ncbi:MAG TPA: 3-phosphoshikimate 1-carboxyvinyltransferase [Acidimicrobiales bacterium]|jgi:3-phosphoshikimate 1-carboxyvinyltransferase|nr:3-phosphoshikimate 1-carboxyvinyltransferase [Acidimicrobiales bacterium]
MNALMGRHLALPGRQGPVTGRLRPPGDKSISHRALLLAALAEGRSELRNLSAGLDVAHTRDAMATCGAAVSGALGAGGVLSVLGGRSRLREPAAVIDVGNSGTAIRLLAGWSAAFPWLTVLQGDGSIATRPMARVTEPLRAMGARIDGRDGGRFPPLVVRGGQLTGIDYRLPVPSAQVKAAILLAGLSAAGHTTVREDIPTRAHTEELLARCGADISVTPGSAAGAQAVTVRPSPVNPLDLTVPADPSQAAFWVVAACVVPGSDLVVEDVYVGPARAGFLDVLRRMGADVALERPDAGRHTADIHARYRPLTGTWVGGDEVPAVIDEIPVLAVAAARATGDTVFADAAELRVKESDRVASTVGALSALGARAEGRADGLVVHGAGDRPLSGGTVDSRGDHRIAMAAAVAAIDATGPTVVAGWDSVATSYPGFEEDLHRCVS